MMEQHRNSPDGIIVVAIIWIVMFTAATMFAVYERVCMERLSDAIRNAKDNGDETIYPLVQHYGFDTLELEKYSLSY